MRSPASSPTPRRSGRSFAAAWRAISSNPPSAGGSLRGAWGGGTTAITRDAWVIPLLSLLGYDVHANPHPYEVDGTRFAISHRAGVAAERPPHGTTAPADRQRPPADQRRATGETA